MDIGMPAWGDPCSVIYGASIFTTTTPYALNPTAMNSAIAAATGSILVLDAESPDPIDVPTLINALIQARSASNQPVGFYCLSLGNYWDANGAHGVLSQNAWYNLNDSYAPLLALVDFICPSLYTYYPDQAGWMQYALENISEAKRTAPGKPVYPFIMPEYDPSASNGLAGTYVGDPYWRMQLSTIRALADGVIVWGGYQAEWNTANSWQPMALEFAA